MFDASERVQRAGVGFAFCLGSIGLGICGVLDRALGSDGQVGGMRGGVL